MSILTKFINVLKGIYKKIFGSIQANMAFSFSLLVLFTVASVSNLAFRLTYDASARKAIETTHQLLDQLNRTIDTYIGTLDTLSMTVLNSRELKDVLENGANDADAEWGISLWFESICGSRRDLAAISWFGADGRVLTSRLGETLNPWVRLENKRWMRAVSGANGKPVVLGPHVQDLFPSDNYRWVFSQARVVHNANTGYVMGILKVDMNFNLIEEMCSRIQLGQSGYVFIVDQFGDIVYHPRQQLIYSNLIEENIEDVMKTEEPQISYRRTVDGKDRWYTVRILENTGWRVVGVTYDDELVSNKSEMRLTFVLVGFGVLLLGLVLAVFTSRELARPVKLLEKSMKQVEQGNFDVRANVESPAEIANLGHSFNLMTGKIKELMQQNIREQELKRKSELNALQAQINPHFLYNTLDSIIWMAEGGKNDKVILMTSALVKLFRIGISRGAEMIAAASELEHIRSYLVIQKMRYEDKLDFSIEADPDILLLKMPKILLQPLVENAIYHGIKNKEGMGHIKVKGFRKDDMLIFTVEDDGVGMTESKCRQLLTKTSRADSMKGVGVWNVHERIQLHFGNGYGLSFQSTVGEGTIVTVRLPVLKNDTNETAGGNKA